MSEETWPDRELVILQAIREAEEAGENLDAAAKGAIPNLEARLYRETIYSLNEDRYLDAAIQNAGAGELMVHVRRLLPNGRRAIRQWPSGTMADLLLEHLERAIENETDENRKSRLRRFADGAAGVGKDVLTGVLAAVATSAAGAG